MRKTIALLAATLTLAACMEMEQEPARKQVGQTVKGDTAPWNNEPLAGGPKWTKGDRNSWEEQIKRRQLAQNERTRINP